MIEPANAVSSDSATVPDRWPGYLMALAATSICVGIIWDISWHITIGRDTFWTPAHMAVYFGGTLAGCVGGWLAIKHTFLASPEERAASVNVFGARAPLGAWVAIWGAIAMLTSAPFDNWWHNAYGLDVKIISPPHALLGMGMLGISAGALLLTLARQNRESNGVGAGMFVFMGGIFLTFGAIFILEFSYPNHQHGAAFYEACSLMLAFRLVTAGRAGRISWPATRVALVYMLVECLLIWILPLFPGHPKLAPIYNPVTHMVPPVFPVLLVFPALGIDLVLRQMKENEGALRLIPRALLVGAIFLVGLLVVQWFFAEFMLSPYADNWFFGGGRYWGYRTPPGSWRNEFFDHDPGNPDKYKTAADALTLYRFVRCWIIASVASWLGLLWGGWMRKVKR